MSAYVQMERREPSQWYSLFGRLVYAHFKPIGKRKSCIPEAILRIPQISQQICIALSTRDGVIGEYNCTRSKVRLDYLHRRQSKWTPD